MTRKTLNVAFPILMALAAPLLAGGFFLELGSPEASLEARQSHAVLTVMAAGCHDPAAAEVTARAIGTVNGERRSMALKLTKLSKPGMFALAQQWPKEGQWVIELSAKNGEMFTNTLVKAGPEGIDRLHAKWAMKQFTQTDVAQMLED